MTQQATPPKIEFPCADYPVKIIGSATPEFTELVLDIVARHAPDLDPSALRVRDSRGGRFLSVQVRITATGIDQLQAIHRDLQATGLVHMVL